MVFVTLPGSLRGQTDGMRTVGGNVNDVGAAPWTVSLVVREHCRYQSLCKDKLGWVSTIEPTCYSVSGLFALARLLGALDPPISPHLLVGAHLGFRESDENLQL